MNLPADPFNLLADTASLINQNQRLLNVVWPENCGFDTSLLVPRKLTGTEELSSDYAYQLELLSIDETLPAKFLHGLPIGLSILLENGETRALSGIVQRVRRGQSDGGFTPFLIQISSALGLMTRLRDSRIFLGKSVPEILVLILEELQERHPGTKASLIVENHLAKNYPPRDLITMYRETGYSFFTRLSREVGISYRFEHVIENGIPIHKLILWDDAYSLPMIEQNNGEVRFHRADATEATDSIDLWESERSTQPARTTLNSWVYQTSHIDHGSESTWMELGESAPQLEDYDPQTSHYGDEQELRELTQLRQQAHDLKTKTFFAAGTARHLYPGANFALTGHPVHDQDSADKRQFVVLSQKIAVWNNLPEGQGKDGKPDQPPYRSELTLVRRGIPIVPEYGHTEHAKPRAWGPQTATVVTRPNEEITTNERGEIRIQYSWQRPESHNLERTGGAADFDDKSSFWVRVAHDIAGDRWGAQWIPRKGQEVLVDFIEGDIDRPVCVKVLHNARHENPHFSGSGSLPANKALSGTKTKEIDGQGYNELLFDDSTGEQRVKLSSEHAKSQINMGYLNHPRTEGKGEPRGEGIEMRTDANIALRGAQGLLITTEARYKASGKQMDRQALNAAMTAAQELAKVYGDLSNTHHADNTDLGELKKLIDKIEAWEKGSNTDKSGTGGGAPIVAVSAPAGMAMSSGEEMAVTTGTNLDIVTRQSTQITSGKNLLARVKDRISLFAHQLGIKLVAASGKVEIQAHSDNIEMTAAKNIEHTALDTIVHRCKRFLIIADGASLEIGPNGIISKTTGAHVRHAGQHLFPGPASIGLILPALPTSPSPATDLILNHRYHDEEAVQGATAILKLADGSKREGLTNELGETVFKDVPPGPAQVKYRADGRVFEQLGKIQNARSGQALDDIVETRTPKNQASLQTGKTKAT